MNAKLLDPICLGGLTFRAPLTASGASRRPVTCPPARDRPSGGRDLTIGGRQVGEQSGLPAYDGFRRGEGHAVCGDPQDGDCLWPNARNGRDQAPGAGAEFCQAQFRGARRCSWDQGGDADSAICEVVAVPGREVGRGVDEPVGDACLERGRVKAITAPGKVRLYR